MDKFVQNSVFSPRSACFVIFALGTPLFCVFSKVHAFVQNSVFSRASPLKMFALGGPLFSAFQQSTPVCTKQHFQPEIRTFRHFGTGTSVFSVYTKVHDLVLTSVFRTRSARFVILALGAPLFGNLLQSAWVCAKQRFQPELSTFFHFRTKHTTF